jgi:septum formation protein
MGVPFRVVVSDVDEGMEGPPQALVVTLAQRKAQAVAARCPGDLVLAADTVVACGDAVLGKPRDEEDAARMLALLAGRWHDVYTGLCAIDAAIGRQETALDRTRVRFLPLTARDIAGYVATGEPMGKAGAYAIQGRAGMYVQAIEGSPSNVMGLPMAAARQLLQKFHPAF